MSKSFARRCSKPLPNSGYGLDDLASLDPQLVSQFSLLSFKPPARLLDLPVEILCTILIFAYSSSKQPENDSEKFYFWLFRLAVESTCRALRSVSLSVTWPFPNASLELDLEDLFFLSDGQHCIHHGQDEIEKAIEHLLLSEPRRLLAVESVVIGPNLLGSTGRKVLAKLSEIKKAHESRLA